MLSYLRKKFKRKTLKSNIQRYIAKQKDICCENDVDRKQVIENMFGLYTEMSGKEYLSDLYTDFGKFIGYKEDLQRKRDNQGLSLLTELEKDTHVNGRVDKEAITNALLDVPLYYLLSFLGYAYYRYKVDIIPETTSEPSKSMESPSDLPSDLPSNSPMDSPMDSSDIPRPPTPNKISPMKYPMSYKKTSISKYQTLKSPSKFPFKP